MKSFLFAFALILSTLFAFGQTQYEINQQAGKADQQANKTLDSVYRQIIQQYRADTAFIQNLKLAENAWIKFRDAQFKMKYPDRPAGYYGSILPMCESNYLEELTEQRIKTLKEWLTGAEQGDACCGSVRMNRLYAPYTNIPLTPEEAKDDTVFDDGSIVTGTGWKVSGIYEPFHFKKFLKYLKKLVKNNNRKEIARFIDYPTLQSKRNTWNIKNENDFISNYDRLFNDRVKTALEDQKLNQIFRNYQGAMVGGGQLWFEETSDGGFKIIAINY